MIKIDFFPKFCALDVKFKIFNVQVANNKRDNWCRLCLPSWKLYARDVLIFVKLMKMNEKLKIIFPRKPQIEPRGEIFVLVFRTEELKLVISANAWEMYSNSRAKSVFFLVTRFSVCDNKIFTCENNFLSKILFLCAT